MQQCANPDGSLMKTSLFYVAWMGLFGFATVTLAADTKFPTRPIRMIVASSAGTGADIFARLGKPVQEMSALSRSQAWDILARSGPDTWKAVASIVAPPSEVQTGTVVASVETPNGTEGTLAHNKTLIAGSAATRDAINALLNSVKAPLPPTQ